MMRGAGSWKNGLLSPSWVSRTDAFCKDRLTGIFNAD